MAILVNQKAKYVCYAPERFTPDQGLRDDEDGF